MEIREIARGTRRGRGGESEGEQETEGGREREGARAREGERGRARGRGRRVRSRGGQHGARSRPCAGSVARGARMDQRAHTTCLRPTFRLAPLRSPVGWA